MRNPFAVVTGIVLAVFAFETAAGDRRVDEEVARGGFDVSPGGTLRVDVPDADIVLERGAADRVEVRILLGARDMDWARRRVEGMNLEIHGSGSDVIVTGSETRQRLRWRPGDWFSLVVRVQLPEDFDVDLDSDDGDITVERLRGRVKIRTSDGDIDLGRIDATEASLSTSDGDVRIDELIGGEATIRSSDGDIEIRTLDVRRATLRTSDGDIAVRSASGELEASTSDGDVEIRAERLQATTLTSGDGDITVRLGRGAGFDLELKGEQIELAGAFQGEAKESWARGRVNGGGPLVRATTRDGHVEVIER